uniref:Uncharacterized protein n=1 Tax=viral metagenome TaxID=1070528 RepID=A0A6C0KWA7_9ZZZZ
MRGLLITLLSLFVVSHAHISPPALLIPETCSEITNGCISFSVSAGTGCAWMCNYCANQLGPNYYFTDQVCTYQAGGCVGNPQAGVTYTCCST